MRVAGHERIFGEARIGRRVLDLQRFGPENRLRTEGVLARRLRGRYPDLGFEPLSIAIEQADHRNGYIAQLRGNLRDPIEKLLGRRIENCMAIELIQPLAFVHRQ